MPSILSPMIASTMASSPSGSARTPASNLGEPHVAAHSPMANARVRTCGEETWRRSEHLHATRGWAGREGAYAFEAELHRLEDRLLGQKVAEALDHQHRVGAQSLDRPMTEPFPILAVVLIRGAERAVVSACMQPRSSVAINVPW